MLSTKRPARAEREDVEAPPNAEGDVYPVADAQPNSYHDVVIPPSPFSGPVQDDTEFSEKPPWKATAATVVFAIGFGLAGLRAGSLITELAAVVIGLTTLHGIWRGGLRKGIMFGFAVMLGCFTLSYPNWPEPGFNLILGHPSPTGTLVVTVVSAAAAWLGVKGLVEYWRRQHVRIRRGRIIADRCIGALFGVGQGAFFMLAVCWITAALHPLLVRAGDRLAQDDSVFGAEVLSVMQQIGSEATVGPFADIVYRTSLIEVVPGLSDAVNTANRGRRPSLDQVDFHAPTVVQDWVERVIHGSGTIEIH